ASAAKNQTGCSCHSPSGDPGGEDTGLGGCLSPCISDVFSQLGRVRTVRSHSLQKLTTCLVSAWRSGPCLIEYVCRRLKTNDALNGDFYARQKGRLGPSFRRNSCNPAVKDRINCVNALLCNSLGERRLVVDPHCRNLIRDLEQVCWKQDV